MPPTTIDALPDEQELGRYSMRELRREMQTRVTESRRILDAGPAEKRSAEDTATAARLDKEMDRLEAAIEDRAKIDRRSMIGRQAGDMPGVPGDPADTPSDHRRFVGIDQKTGREVRAVLPGERLADALNLTREERQLSVGRYLRGLITGNWTGAEAEHRAMTVGEFVAGGALVPAPLAAMLIDLARAQSVVIRLGAQTIPMISTTLDLARVVTDPSATWYGEEVRASGLTESQGSFGRLTLNAHTLAILERASVELAEDAPNFAQVLEQQLGAALANELDRAVLFGIAAQGWSGLRGNPDPWTLNEISMGTNGAAITDFAKFVESIQKILEGNFTGILEDLGMAMAPRTWATVEKFEDTTGQPLRPPASYEKPRKAVSTQIGVAETQGSASDASTVFVADWSQVVIGARTNITLEATREGGDAFERLHVLFRGYLRADWAVLQAKWVTRIIGIIP